ncbi:hypothetical protein Lal_00014083 [Lupinus albus]|nr:hypothetical protein Lal_00014083 [Lupinus albus]
MLLKILLEHFVYVHSEYSDSVHFVAFPNFDHYVHSVYVPYVLKTGQIHLLPKFNGLASQDPYKHLKEFHIVCSTMKPHDVMEDHICLKVFPHSLEGPTKYWLYYLAYGSITSWGDLKRSFLGKLFHPARTTTIRKDISGIRHQHGESLYEYWAIFKRLCASCPHHQIFEQLLLQYFYEGLNNMDRSIIDATSGGTLGDMTPFEVRCLIEKMASNSQQFNARSGDAIVVRGVYDVGTNAARQDKLETKIDSLTTLITQLAMNQQKSSMARVCGICTSTGHHSDVCPSLLEPITGDHLEAYAANIYNNRPPHQQQLYNPPSSSTYKPGWRNQAPFHNNVGQNRPSYVPPPIQQQRHQMINNLAPVEPSLEELVRQMAMQNMQFQQETRASIQRQESSIQNLTTQMVQMATSLNTLQSQNSDKLPSHNVLNPRNVSGITLRSGKQTKVPTPRTDFMLQKEHDMDSSKRNKSVLEENDNTTRETHANHLSSSAAQQIFSIPLLFPPKIIPTKKMGNMEELDKDFLDTFRKIEVKILLLDAIKQILRYAKFLKELCTHKRKLKGNERISMGGNVSAMIGMHAPHIPEKCKDPGTFTIPCIIGKRKFENAMLDVGASINVMPMNVFKFLSLRPLQPMGVVIQLENRSIAYPAGLVEDVLVRVDQLIFLLIFTFLIWKM